jgi:glycyl-tRNA synthetase beta chain
MAELLLELLSEEIPARMQARAADDLKRLVTEELLKAGLEFDRAEAYVTPRRLALVVYGLPTETPDISEERRGPRADAPEKAIEGFLRANGITLDQAEKRETDKGEFYFAVIEKKGRKTREAVPLPILFALSNLPWPKSMRWSDPTISYVRPLHSILLVFDSEPFVGWLELRSEDPKTGKIEPTAPKIVLTENDKKFESSIRISNQTTGHRFLAPDAFTIVDFADYKEKLFAAKVVLDPAERQDKIKSDAVALAKKAGLVLKDDPALLDEVTGLIEWPVVLMGTIDDAFMDIPPEVLTTAMRSHQKYFALETQTGALAPKFILVANTETADGGAAVIAGNERVLRARLSDAKFFWDQDRKESLESRIPALNDIVFHAKLGSLGDKIDRIEALAVDLAGHIDGADKDHVRSAARLAKADLTTQMVYEFPELQGVMGRYYALNDGEGPRVADAIAAHYSPAGPADDCPAEPVSIAVALADKIDTLVGFWAIDEKPTGSKDPYALRRAALGVIRLILENGIRLDLTDLCYRALQQFDYDDDPIADLIDFFEDRLKVQVRGQGVPHDHVSAIFNLTAAEFAGDSGKAPPVDLVRVMRRVDALGTFLDSDDGANLLVAYRRAANILRIEEKNDGKSYASSPDAKTLQQNEEQTLFTELTNVIDGIAPILKKEDYADAMERLSTLRKPVDDFFDHVTVNCDEPTLRENRLKLLSEIRATMNQVADFSQIEGGER